MADEIGLSDQQIEQLKTMQEAHRVGMVDARATAEKAKIRLQSVMQAKNADDQEVLRAIDESARAKAEIAKKRYLNRQECMSILTESQQSKLQELREDRQTGKREMRMERQDQRRNFRDNRFDSKG
ncbi:MAG: Spy/CpxP family protein refolding chaperone [Alphaproteobacteria bacterium]|nr:Spy/CpxP family protein refolding chaperone [Alphaproteobacteria bacterium]